MPPYSEAIANIGGAFTNIDGIVAGPDVASYAVAINDKGVVGGGIYSDVAGSARGFIFHDGIVEHIGTFGGSFSTVTAINNLGAAAGYAAIANDFAHAYIYQDGTLQDIGVLYGDGSNYDSYGNDINNLGEVAGSSGSSPMVYSGGIMTRLAHPSDYGGVANALNDHSVVVGYSFARGVPGETGYFAFVYANDVLVDLNTLVDPLGGWQLTSAADINNAGQILGTACQNSNCLSVLLTPVPEPATGLMLLVGLGVLAPLTTRRRRQTAACRCRRELRTHKNQPSIQRNDEIHLTFGDLIMISLNFAAAYAATFLLASAITSAANAAPLYTVSFLPTGFQGAQLNDVGQVVGTAGGAAALYSGGSVTTLVPGPSYGTGINNQGDIVGSLNPYSEAFTYIGGNFTSIHAAVASPGNESYGIAINDHGLVGGHVYRGGEDTRGFLYHDGIVEEIGTFGGDYSPLLALNNHGAATGYAAFQGPAGGYFHAYLYQDGILQDLDTLAVGTVSSAGVDINDLGQIVGYAGSRAVLFSGGAVIDLGDLGGYGGYAYALNEAGTIVGEAFIGYSAGAIAHAFVYANGVMTDLNALIAPLGGWEVTVANDINEAGQILGTACQGGSCASVLLTPVPEPSAGLMLLAGLGALVPLMARRRTRCAAAEVIHAVRGIHEVYPTNGGIS